MTAIPIVRGVAFFIAGWALLDLAVDELAKLFANLITEEVTNDAT